MESLLQLESVMQWMTGTEREDEIEQYNISGVIVWVKDKRTVQVCTLGNVMHEGMTWDDSVNEQK